MCVFDSQSIQLHLCLNLRIYTIAPHSHTPGIKDVPVTGVHSIRHPEEQLIVIEI
jgi:hypothetical protein